MDLMMVLPWIQVSFECYVGIWIPYMKKTGFVYGNGWCTR